MWLTHHWHGDQDRCVRLGTVDVCRRCAVLYPLVVLWATLTVLIDPPQVVAVVAMWLLPLPMTLEWVAEHQGGVRYSATRQAALTALASVGVGAALAAHLVQPFDADALAPMATHATICGVSALRASRSGGRSASAGSGAWQQEHELAEAERTRALVRLLDDQDGNPGRTE